MTSPQAPQALQLILPAKLDAESRLPTNSEHPPLTHSPSAPASPSADFSSSPPSSHRRSSTFDTLTTASSTSSFAWQPSSALPSPPALSEVLASAAFFGLHHSSAQDEDRETTSGESGVWGDAEDEADYDGDARVRGAALRRERRKLKRASSAPVVDQLPPPPLLPSRRPTISSTFSSFTYGQSRVVASPQSSTLVAAPLRRRRGAPLVYLQHRSHTCTCNLEYSDSTTTSEDSSEDEGEAGKAEKGQKEGSALEVKGQGGRRSLFLVGAAVRGRGL